MKKDAYYANRVFNILAEHRGRELAVTSAQIAKDFSMPNWIGSRDVRRLIQEHGNKSWPGVLCAIPGKGYFFAVDLEEIHVYREYLVGLKKEAANKLKSFDTAIDRAGFNLQEAA